MVLGGMTYEAPSYLLLPLLSARPPLLVPVSQLIPPSSRTKSCLLNFHSPYTLIFPPHLSPVDPLSFKTSPPIFLLFSILSRSLCPHPSSHFMSLSTGSCSACLFFTSSHSFSPVLLSLGSTHIEKPLLVFTCRELIYLKSLNGRCSSTPFVKRKSDP